MLRQEQAQRLFELALIEFAPGWEIVGTCDVNLGNPDHWPSGVRTFGFILRNRTTGATRVLGRRRGDDPIATYHRGLSYRVLEAYDDRLKDPIARYLEEIGVLGGGTVGEDTGEVAPRHQISEQIFHRWKARYGPNEGDRPRRRDLPRYLAIVSRDEPELAEYLRRRFSVDPGVQVLLDRRKGERRQRNEPREPNRRGIDRRRGPTREDDLHFEWVVFTRQQEPMPAEASPDVERREVTQPAPPSPSVAPPRLDSIPVPSRPEPAMPSPEASVAGTEGVAARAEVDARLPVGQWIEKIQSLLPELVNEHEQLKARIMAAEAERERLARDLEGVQTENHILRSEWDDIEVQFDKLMRAMASQMEGILDTVAERGTRAAAPGNEEEYRRRG